MVLEEDKHGNIYVVREAHPVGSCQGLSSAIFDPDLTRVEVVHNLAEPVIGLFAQHLRGA